jgi:hypothetical protein
MAHSDKEKFRSDLNSPESCAMSERLLKTLGKSGARELAKLELKRAAFDNGSIDFAR